LFEAVERGEELSDVVLVGGLRVGEPGLVNTVVDILVHPSVECVDLFSKVLGYEGGHSSVRFSLFRGEEVIKTFEQHPYNIAAVIVYDGA
jgi:hypothetical protein